MIEVHAKIYTTQDGRCVIDTRVEKHVDGSHSRIAKSSWITGAPCTEDDCTPNLPAVMINALSQPLKPCKRRPKM